MEGGGNVLCSKNGTRPSSSAAYAVASRARVVPAQSQIAEGSTARNRDLRTAQPVAAGFSRLCGENLLGKKSIRDALGQACFDGAQRTP
jgi:hypothetical protein